ncbi:MAG: hypothetical protein ACYYKD_13500 [Rhodospirillales bacterium]
MVFPAYARKILTRWALAAALGCAVLAAPAPFSALSPVFSPALSPALGADLGAGLAVPPVAGLGAGPARALAAAMAEMLAAQGFRAESGFIIAGRAEVRRQGETTAWVALNWNITAADGRTHNTAAREILVDQARWAGGEALTMRYAAAETAPDVLKILARLGIPPESGVGLTTSETAPASAPEQAPAPPPEPWPGGEPPVFLVHPAVITGVGVADSGGAELALAMGRALRALGAGTAPAAGAETGATHIVRAEAAVSEVSGDMQQIRIIWHVAPVSGGVSGGASGASGGALGTAEQQNEVPAGALAGPWGGLADQIARAAADGVRRLFIVQPTAEGG